MPTVQEHVCRAAAECGLLTDARVEAGLRLQDVVGGEVDDVAGEAELAADRGFWPQQRKSVGLGSGAASCEQRSSAASSQKPHKVKVVGLPVSKGTDAKAKMLIKKTGVPDAPQKDETLRILNPLLIYYSVIPTALHLLGDFLSTDLVGLFCI